MNTFSLYISRLYSLSKRERFGFIGILSPLIVIMFSYTQQTYNYTMEEWLFYAVRLTIKHFIVYNLIIYLLDRYI